MNKQFEPREFGLALHHLRKRDRAMTLANLAKEVAKVTKVKLSPTALHYLEVGRYKKSPPRETIRAVARALNLSSTETQKLLELGGHSMISESLVDRAVESVQSVLQIVKGPEAEVFIQQVESLADRFARWVSARSEDVRMALIPTAGWQARLLAPEVVERTLIPALHEILHARIPEVVVIAGPGAASRWSLQKQFTALALRIIEQDQPSGLARAIFMARPQAHLGPIAVILPDEVDPRSEALAEVVQQYQIVRRSVIGVNPSPVEKEKHAVLRFYGIAVLKPRILGGRSPRLHELEGPLMEKPQEPRTFPRFSRKIAGRYVLTSEVFESIETTGPELTTALNEHWKAMYAHELRKDLVSLSPYQEIINVISAVESRLMQTKAKQVRLA